MHYSLNIPILTFYSMMWQWSLLNNAHHPRVVMWYSWSFLDYNRNLPEHLLALFMLTTGMDNMKCHSWANDAESWNLPEDILALFMLSTGMDNMNYHAWVNDVYGWNLPEDILDLFMV